MVNQTLIDQTVAELGPSPRKILITGGTGFIGSHLASCLAESGHHVTVLGRSRYPTKRIRHANIRLLHADLRDAQRISECCADQEIVYHVAALTTPWANRTKITQINVRGTQNIIDACLTNNVSRLIHLSSTSVFFNFEDFHDHPDDAPYPPNAACPYSESKRRAEEAIQEAVSNRNLNAFTIRARAVFGDGDNSCLPRLIEAARDGRLRQIGDGENFVDLTYIDNLVWGLVLAANRGIPGGQCTVTNGEPVKLWKLLPQVLAKLNISFKGKRISYRVAHCATGIGEFIHWAFRRSGEPKLTRYTLGLLAKNQVFSLAAAERELGYTPLVPIQTGLDRTIAGLQRTNHEHASTVVKLKCFTTGFAVSNRKFVERSSPREVIRFHALVGLIDHPTQGLTLFDTGCAPRLRQLPGLSAKVYNRLLPAQTSQRLSIANQLLELEIAPNQIQRIIISHFHPDHVAGLKDFPDAEFIASRQAWESVRNRQGIGALRHGLLPGLLPDDFESRLHLVEHFNDEGIGPFSESHDLFGDGSLRMFELPGHAAGQIGVLAQTADDSRDFLVADAAWTMPAIRESIMPHLVTKIFVDSFSDMKQTLNRLGELTRQVPDIRLIPTHCPEVAERFGFDDKIDEPR